MGLIDFKNVEVKYNKKKTVLKNVNLEINEGLITVLLGPNGSGKTTLMSTINRLIKPTSGEIHITGKNINTFRHKELASQIATVPQSNAPNFSYSVLNMVMWGRAPYISYMPKKEDYEIVDATIERVGITHLRDKLINNLSGGEKQMVLIARALAQKTGIVLMDEPATYLDLKNQVKLFNLIKEINKVDGVTFVITLHEPNHALFLADDVVLVSKGEAKRGKMQEMLIKNNMEELYQVKSDFISLNGQKYMLVDYRKQS